MKTTEEPLEDNSIGFFILFPFSLCLFVLYSVLTGHIAIFLTIPMFALALYGVEELSIIGLRISLTNVIDMKGVKSYNTPEAKHIYQTKMDPRALR